MPSPPVPARLRSHGAILALSCLLAAALAAGGCASANDLYDRGQRQEGEGKPEDAFESYAEALEREPGLAAAQERLRSLGSELVARHLAGADAAPTPPGRADAYLAADAFVRRAGEVGVALDAPPAFGADRAAALDAAAAWFADEAEEAVRAGRWQTALDAREQAARYAPRPDLAARLDAAAFDALAGWAEADLAAGRYRSAYGRASAALQMQSGAYHPNAERVAALQVEIEARGAVRAAPLPVVADNNRSTADLPRAFEDDVDEVLADEAWLRSPPFVRMADPVEVRRQLRRSGRFDEYATYDGAAAAAARLFDADFAVVVRLSSFYRTAEATERDTIIAQRQRQGGTDRYVRVRERVRLRSSAAVAVRQAADGAAVCSDNVTAEVTDTADRGEYAGDIRDLDLSRAERALFDRDARDREAEEMEATLAERLAVEVARQAYACLERQVR